MTKLLQRVMNIEPDEVAPILMAALYFFFILTALMILRPAREALGKVAQANNLFLSGNVYEIDPHFPELYFQTCFIIGPNGDVILRYRRLTSCFEPTPHDVCSTPAARSCAPFTPLPPRLVMR